MLAFTALAVQVLLWQSQDISVAIVSETEEGSQEVIISVRNTAGSTLLFYENAEMTGKIEYLSEEGWVEYCDVSYTAGNAQAVSNLYGGTFAELEPGEDWNVEVPEDKVAGMKNGTYRIKMTYVTEKKYNEYLENAYLNRNTSEEGSEEESDISSESSSEISEEELLDPSESYPEEENEDFLAGIIPTFGKGNKNEKETYESEEAKEAFLAESVSEVFVKTFEYYAPEDFVSEISIEDSDIETKNKKDSRRIFSKEEQLY